MLRTQGVPEAQIEMFIKMMEKNPELFKTIAIQIQGKVKEGMSPARNATHSVAGGQTEAGMEVMKKYEEELRKLI